MRDAPKSTVPAMRDLAHGSIPRLIAILAAPATLEMALFSVVRLLDAYWMGQVSDLALASVVMGSTLRFVLISPMMGLSMGGMAVVARHVGRKDQELADNSVMQVLLLILFFSLPIAICGYLTAPTFLRWMGASGEILENAISYLRVIFIGLFFMECLPTMSGVIRGAGRPEYTLRINIINVVVLGVSEPILALGWGPIPALGVTGAAVASVLGSVAGVAGVFYLLLTGDAGVGLHLRHIKPDLDIMKGVLRIAIPNAAERLSPNLGSAAFLRIVAGFGDLVLTAYSVFQQVYQFFQAPTVGVSNASATMVGQNLGANEPDRSEESGWIGAWGAAGLSLVLYGVLAFGATYVLTWFHDDPRVIQVAAVGLYYSVVGAAGRGWGQVLGRALGGAGDAISPMVASIGALWMVQIPASWLLSGWLGPPGIWAGMVLGDLAHALAMTWRFRQGRWKKIQV